MEFTIGKKVKASDIVVCFGWFGHVWGRRFEDGRERWSLHRWGYTRV